MKRLSALLFCALLLSGCSAPAKTADETPGQSRQTLHAPGHTLETQTRGMLQVFPTGLRSDCSAYAMGNHLILSDGQELTLLGGKSLEIRKTISAQSMLLTGGSGVCLYNPETRKIQILDTELTVVSDVTLPENTIGLPGVTSGMDGIFFCTAASVCHMDSNGIIRILRDNLDIRDAEIHCLEDSLLFISLTDSTGKTDRIFLDPANGSNPYPEWKADTAASHNGTLYWANTDPQTREICLMEAGSTPQQLNPGKGHLFLSFLPDITSVITWLPSTGGQAITANLYDLSTGQLRSTVALEGIDLLTGACSCEDGTLYLTARCRDTGEYWLLRWNYDAFPPESDAFFLSPRYTAQAPDWQGMQDCRTRAEAVSKKYGVFILLFEAAAEVQPWDYRFTAEYRVPETNWALDTIERSLDQFPKGFLETLTGSHDSLAICLLGNIQGTAESGSLETAQGLQFSEDNRCFIALTTTGTIEYNLFHEFSHLIDTQVLNRSRAYDNWDTLNPSGFSYAFDFSRDMTKYTSLLQGQSRAFIDTYAMYSPAEDRARILECAANPGNEDYFTSPVMQEKLLRICTGIRETFGLMDAPETFVWEQYLNRPIAPSA